MSEDDFGEKYRKLIDHMDPDPVRKKRAFEEILRQLSAPAPAEEKGDRE